MDRPRCIPHERDCFVGASELAHHETNQRYVVSGVSGKAARIVPGITGGFIAKFGGEANQASTSRQF